jgi:alkane 1-monooxygenase
LKYKLPLYLSVLLEWVFSFWLINYLVVNYETISYFNAMGAIIVASNLAASNINVAHELMHKDSALDKFLGAITL